MKIKIVKVFSIVLTFAFLLSSMASASTSSVAYFYEGETDEYFSPNSGTLHASYYSTYARTTLYFKYDSDRVSTISMANYQSDLYAGVDVKCDPGMALGDKMDAYSVTTTLPNPKTDIEGGETGYNHESEAVARGTLIADKTYTMTTTWNDYRSDTGSSGTGRWTANAELSFKSILDYNTLDWEGLTELGFNGVRGQD